MLVLLFGVIMVAALVAVTLPIRALVVCKLWAWFVVPLGVHQIGGCEAAGLAILAGFLLPSSSRETKSKWPEILIGEGIVAPFLILGIGWVIHQLASG